MTKLPNLFIPGVPKSGTSTLHDMLVQHSEIEGGKTKEPHFYSHDKKYSNRLKEGFPHSLVGFFSENGSAKYRIDSSTSYLISEEALKRIKEDDPNSKFIILARDPFTRIRSHYRWMCSLGFVERPFEKEMLAENKIPFDINRGFWGNFKHYVDFSKYGKQMETILKLFPKEQVLFVKYEDLITNTDETMKSIWEFLQVDSIKVDLPKSNATSETVKPKPRPLSLKISVFIKRVIKSLTFQKQSPWIWSPLKEVPNVSDEQLASLKDLLREDLEKFETLGYNLNGWKLTQNILKKTSE